MIEVTKIAAEKMETHMKQQPSDKCVRISAKGGG